jgi:glycosyltransferase involved in cell wall biosynthesis
VHTRGADAQGQACNDGRALKILQVASPWIAVSTGSMRRERVDRALAVWRTAGSWSRGDPRRQRRFLGTVRVVSAFDRSPPGIGEDILPELIQTLEARRAMDELHPDVVHDHGFVSPVAAPGGTPYVVTAHSAGHRPFDEYYRRLSRRVALVAISHRQRAALAEASWAAVIPNAIDVASFPFRDRKDDYFLFLGRIALEKGAHLAGHAARRAGVPLRIAGRIETPAEQAYFDERVAPLLDGRVTFVEADTESKRDLLAAARALLFPVQWDEAFGLVVAEALACGTPVIAFRRGAVPELIDDGVTGFVVDALDEMVSAIGEVDRLDAAGCRRSVAERFEIRRMVDEYESLYSRLRAGSRGRRR